MLQYKKVAQWVQRNFVHWLQRRSVWDAVFHQRQRWRRSMCEVTCLITVLLWSANQHLPDHRIQRSEKKWWLSDDGRKNWSNIVSCLLNCKWVNNLMKINHWTILQQKPQIASSARSTKAHIITILIHQLHKIDREPYWNWIIHHVGKIIDASHYLNY